MAEPVEWHADGVPYSAQFGDIYYSESGAVAQARHVFLAGCGLPDAWAGHPQWRILETGFGLGLSFLTTWQAWRADPQRPRLLHFVSVEAYPVARDDLLRAASAHPDLAPQAEELAAQWRGLLPGVHRLVFEGGRVLLSLCIGDVQPMLRGLQRFDADSLFLDGFSPERNPQMWSHDTLKSVARFARRGTRLATWTVSRPVRDSLGSCGFQVRKATGLPPKRDCLQGVFDATWTLRRAQTAPGSVTVPGRCAVVGAGLAGAAAADSLARRGWEVVVLEAGSHAAAGASSLPVGVLAPHASPDDALLSRLTRAGVRATWEQTRALLVEGRDWYGGGVLESRSTGPIKLPAIWSEDGPNESWHASRAQLREAGLTHEANAIWHAHAGWVRPAPLIDAWLAHPGIEVRTQAPVAHIEPSSQSGLHGTSWVLRDATGGVLAQADRIVIAAGHQSRLLAPSAPLQAVRGQVAWGRMPEDATMPRVPINGDGHLIAHVPDAAGPIWLSGATFDRDRDEAAFIAEDVQANCERLARLHPAAAQAVAEQFERGAVEAWMGVRCASGDRRPLVGPLNPEAPQGPWLCTAMGSRGLSFAALCAELLAARWHSEPLPLSASLAKALDTSRLRLPGPT
ncbi:FAD-dependent 5-carboxymethylaminomethyl-2-thiouridine(34) oxidoreductase MnmC [Variovorax sp. KK3]|uniref:FAD-dependent 5-carboxymethylaminomethyl-2-thiouridine(34) oxidoreductase MnmC n=1 Tax=Variovorax sp. KK3 TaxID=1855728 RepID=UPI00097C43A9|nr:FAD-dependent 5-carboxymethylaminomethyl-2-thiouridine(34) oxidoreductase MnmC [Variovorax sp. KK3]